MREGQDEAARATRALVDWIGDCVGDVAVAAATVTSAPEAGRIELRLAAITPVSEPRAIDRRSATIALDYLVTLRLDDPIAEHQALADLAFAATEDERYEVAGQGAGELCAALGLPRMAGIVIRTQANRSHVPKRAPLVRAAAVTHLVPLGTVEGVVLGPGDIPVAGATVSLSGVQRAVRTDGDGRFSFTAPAGQPARIAVRGRGATAEAVANPDVPIVIPLPVEI
jgi:hypothetical protein